MQQEEHIERKYNHFRLLDLTRDDLYHRGVAAIDIDEWAPATHRAEPQGGLKGLGPKVRDEPQAIFESVERVYTVWIIKLNNDLVVWKMSFQPS